MGDGATAETKWVYSFGGGSSDGSAAMKNLLGGKGANLAEMASLGEAFGVAVEQFNKSNEALIDNLSNIENDLEKSSNRSDEQLAYYVTQAREIIDHSMMSQKEIFEEMRHLSRQKDLFDTEETAVTEAEAALEEDQ